MQSVISPLITSDILPIPGIDLVADGTRLPVASQSLRAILMINVFHHMGDTRRFLTEASRCIVPFGRICMIEPWVTRWSTRVYAFHSEPFDPGAATWELPLGGPLTGGNGALPWIVFRRDRHVFEAEFPEWSLMEIRPVLPFRYLLSGGVSLRQLAPSWAFRSLARLESLLRPLWPHLAMFAVIVLRKRAS
jgi:hypothetical protein